MIEEALLQNILVFALLAFSIQVALRAGVFSLAGVGCWAIGGYTVAILTDRGVAPVLAILAALVLAAAVSWLLALLLVRLRGLYLALATVAFDLLVTVIATNGGDLTGAANGLFGVPLALDTTQVEVIVAVVAVVLTVLELGFFRRAFEVIREDEELAVAFSVDSKRMRRFAFVLSGVIGALSGAVAVLLFGAISPTESGFSLIVLALTMVIVGGFNSWVGALIGAALITWLPVGLQGFSSWWNVIYGGVLIVMAVYVPGGILGVLGAALRHRPDRLRPGRGRTAPEPVGRAAAPPERVS